jgi:transposase
VIGVTITFERRRYEKQQLFEGKDVFIGLDVHSGFWLHRALTAQGVSNIVVHAAAVEVSARDRVKTDKRDSLKIAQQLAAGRLRGIRIPT